MSNKLLDYVFPISVITPTPAASTAFLKQACVVVKPKSGQEGEIGNITLCTSKSAVLALTDNLDAAELFDAGMNRVYILPMADLDMSEVFEDGSNDFYTLLISDDFDDDDIGTGSVGVKSSKKIQDVLYTAVEAGEDGDSITISYVDGSATGDQALVSVTTTAITVDIDPTATTAETIADAINDDDEASLLVVALCDVGDEDDLQAVTGGAIALENGGDGDGLSLGSFDGVVGVQTQDVAIAEAHAIISNRAAFITSSTNKGKNMCFAFGSLLSNSVNWLNQQYIEMPYNDDIETLGDANNYFDEKISFVLHDAEEFGNRLALFAAGSRAIAAPYILKNLMIDMQSKALQWISGNQPAYTKKEAALLEARIQEDVINSFIARNWITAGTIEITLVEDNFVANGAINVAEPKALWRVFNEMRQTL